MRVNMKKYQPKQPNFIHYGFEHSVPIGDFSLIGFMGIVVVTYLVRLFSYTEPGPIYAASAAMTVFTIFFYILFVGKVMRGKSSIYYRREYVNIHRFLYIHKSLSCLAGSILLGNVAYYISRSRIWNEPGQIELMFRHAFSLPVYGIVAAVSGYIIYYLFFNEHYIQASDFNQRMQMKVLKFKIDKREAFLEIMKEQDEYHLNESIRGVEGTPVTPIKKKTAKLTKKIYEDDTINEEFLDEVIQENEYDVYESAKIKRGD